MPTSTADRIPVRLVPYPGAASLVRATGRFLGHEYTFELVRSRYPDDCAIRSWVRYQIHMNPDDYNDWYNEDDDSLDSDTCYDCGWSIYSCACDDPSDDD